MFVHQSTVFSSGNAYFLNYRRGYDRKLGNVGQFRVDGKIHSLFAESYKKGPQQYRTQNNKKKRDLPKIDSV